MNHSLIIWHVCSIGFIADKLGRKGGSIMTASFMFVGERPSLLPEQHWSHSIMTHVSPGDGGMAFHLTQDLYV